MNRWTNLTTCYGEGYQSPSEECLKSTLKELFESKDCEHPDAWVECGSDDGPLLSLSVFSSGYAIFTKYSDADMSEEIESRRIENVTEEHAFNLWKQLLEDGVLEI